MKMGKLTVQSLPVKPALIDLRRAADIEDEGLTFIVVGAFPTVTVEDLPVSRRTGGQDERTTTTAQGGGHRQHSQKGR